MINVNWELIEDVGHNAFLWFWTWYLNMLKDHVFTDNNIVMYAVFILFVIGLMWLTSFLFQDNDD